MHAFLRSYFGSPTTLGGRLKLSFLRILEHYAKDEGVELSYLRARGLLEVNSDILKALDTCPNILKINARNLKLSRWFFYRVDEPLRKEDVHTERLDYIPYWNKILTNKWRPWEYKWILQLLKEMSCKRKRCLEIGCGLGFPLTYLLAKFYEEVVAIDIDAEISRNLPCSGVSFVIGYRNKTPL